MPTPLRYLARRSRLFAVLLACLSLLPALSVSAQGGPATADFSPTALTYGQITEYPASAGSNPSNIAVGPDGNLWFTEYSGNRIGKITPTGATTPYPVPTVASQPNNIIAGPDGNLWFTEESGNKIGRITTSGIVTEYPIPTVGSRPWGITVGPDGALWFTEFAGNKIGKITTTGAVTEYSIPTTNSRPTSIAAGSDGNLWFTELSGNKVGRITPDGVITEYTMPSAGSGPHHIVAGPDDTLWFTVYYGNKIGRITTAGAITEYPLPEAESFPAAIAAGPDGNLWFVLVGANKIGRITPAGVITTFTVPTAFSWPYGIVTGPDGHIWFTEQNANKLGKLNLDARCTSSLITITDNAPAAPYPATLTVSGLPTSLSTLTVSLNAVNHTYPDDLDVLLVGPQGQKTLLMSDAGGGANIAGTVLSFANSAEPFPDTLLLTSRAYYPTDHQSGESLPSPAPAAPYATDLSAFTGSNPNGTWQLYIADDQAQDSGNIASGFCLYITSEQSLYLPLVMR